MNLYFAHERVLTPFPALRCGKIMFQWGDISQEVESCCEECGYGACHRDSACLSGASCDPAIPAYTSLES